MRTEGVKGRVSGFVEHGGTGGAAVACRCKSGGWYGGVWQHAGMTGSGELSAAEERSWREVAAIDEAFAAGRGIEPFGVEISERLAAVAREQQPQRADRIWWRNAEQRSFETGCAGRGRSASIPGCLSISKP